MARPTERAGALFIVSAVVVVVVVIASAVIPTTEGFSVSSSGSSSSSSSSSSNSLDDVSRRKLWAAWSSPSGKLTLTPELIIPEPKDATSILLLSNTVQSLSEGIRNCKANAAFLHGSLNALQTFTNEQSTALGSFPGPVPVIYCQQQQQQSIVDCKAIAEAGADGILLSVTWDDMASATLSSSSSAAWTEWTANCQAARQAGLQPIPEIIVADNVVASWSAESSVNVVDTLLTNVVAALGGFEPVAVVLTIMPSTTVSDNDDDAADDTDTSVVPVAREEEEELVVTIPVISKATSKRVPILGSVRATAGENRLWEETMRFKEAGFSGTILRGECVPGVRLLQQQQQQQPNLEFVSKFWQACITDLKSTRSKSFSFRSKNQLNVSAATKWGNYQKSVLDSGALGDPQENASLNEAAGDYQGFA